MFFLKDAVKSKESNHRSNVSSMLVKTSGVCGKTSASPSTAVKRPKHANQVVNNNTSKLGGHDRRFTSKRNVSRLTTGLLVAFRGFESMIRRSFQLSGSYDIITTWEDLQAAAVMSTTTSMDASEKMANRDSAVLTSYDGLSPPASTENQIRSASVSSTVTNSSCGSSRTTGTVSPSSTPSSKPRVTRRRTIIFGTKTDKVKDEVDADQEIGIGRFIPVKQGNLLKRTTNSLNKEWKKKFVVLNDGGIFTYYPSVNDYINDVHGKHVFLKQSTVKIPGQRPPIASSSQVSLVKTRSPKTGNHGTNRANSLEDELLRNHRKQENGSLIISNDFLAQDCEREIKNALSSTANNVLAPTTPMMKVKPELLNKHESLPRKRGRNRRGNKHTKSCELDFSSFPEELQKTLINAGQSSSIKSRTSDAHMNSRKETNIVVNSESPLVSNAHSGSSSKKKGHRRSKSYGTGKMYVATDNKTDTRNGQVEEYEFRIVSLDGKSWNFAAQSLEDREQWVFAIEQQILTCLQSNSSGRDKMNSNSSSESDLLPIRHVPGNHICADCGEPNPDWATLNLGALICITCCGIHRNLGTHLSRVRSLDLDEWPETKLFGRINYTYVVARLELRTVMLSIGNTLANSIWEARSQTDAKPNPSSPREEKEQWIRAKYQKKEFLQSLSTSSLSLGQRLIEAVQKEDLSEVILLLAHSERKDVNEHEDDELMRTPLHISCCKGNIVITLLLIWYFADVGLLDSPGRTALWYARESGSKECEEILRHSGCSTTGRLGSCSESSNSSDLTS